MRSQPTGCHTLLWQNPQPCDKCASPHNKPEGWKIKFIFIWWCRLLREGLARLKSSHIKSQWCYFFSFLFLSIEYCRDAYSWPFGSVQNSRGRECSALNMGRHATYSTIKQPLPLTVVTHGSAAMRHNVQGSDRGNTIGHGQQQLTKTINYFLKILTSNRIVSSLLRDVTLRRSINKWHLRVQGAGIHWVANIPREQNTL